MNPDDTLGRLFTLLAREIHSTSIDVVASDSPIHGDLEHRLRDGRRLVVFVESRDDLESRQRRLDILVEAFSGALESTPPPKTTSSLEASLSALANRTGAVGAIVIDAQSPMIWGTSLEDAPYNVVSFDRTAAAPSDDSKLIFRVIEHVRALPHLALLRKGAPLEVFKWESSGGYYVRSFAAIYLLTLIFREPFDDLRVEPLVTGVLPQIERMVLALPPVHPPDGSGAAALRKSRG